MKRIAAIVSRGLLLALVAEGTAWAGPIRVRLEDVTAGTGVTITDNGPGDLNAAVGAIAWAGGVSAAIPAIGVVQVLSAPLLGGLTDFGRLFVNAVDINALFPTTFRITAENSDFVAPTGVLGTQVDVNGLVINTPGSSFEIQSWANGANVVPALGPDVPVSSPLGPIGGIPAGSSAVWAPIFSTGVGGFGNARSGTFDNGAGNTFSLFTQVTIDVTGTGFTNFTSNVRAVRVPSTPEPASLLLLTTGLCARGLIRRRQRSQ